MKPKSKALETSRNQIKSWGNVNPFVLQRILPYVTGRVLDAGCATGGYAQALSKEGYHTFGCDLFFWQEWQYTLSGRAVQADVSHLPFPSAKFDTVISFNVLEHIPDIEYALAEIRRVCQGHFILSVPNCQYFPEMGKAGLTFHHWIDHSHVHFWELESLQKFLIGQGFHIILLEQFGTVRPETLLFQSLGFPLALTRGLARIFQTIPWRKSYAPLLLAVVTVDENWQDER